VGGSGSRAMREFARGTALPLLAARKLCGMSRWLDALLFTALCG
jgi:hypothetical protein